MMDQNQHNPVVSQFKLKHSDALSEFGKSRRKFSPQFRMELLEALEASKLTQREFAEAIGISLSVISKCRRRLEFKPPTDHDRNGQSFQQIDIEGAPHSRSELYLESQSGVKVYGLSLSQISDLLRAL